MLNFKNLDLNNKKWEFRIKNQNIERRSSLILLKEKENNVVMNMKKILS